MSDHSSTVSRLMVAFNARDLDGWMAHATDDHEVESRFSSVAGTIFRGRDGVAAWWSDLSETWDPIEAELERSRDLGSEETVILMTLHGTGRGSGLRLDEPVALRFHWHGQRLAQMQYMDRREAELIVEGDPPDAGG